MNTETALKPNKETTAYQCASITGYNERIRNAREVEADDLFLE